MTGELLTEKQDEDVERSPGDGPPASVAGGQTTAETEALRDNPPQPRRHGGRRKGAGRPKGSANTGARKQTNAQRSKALEKELARILVMPAIPSMMFAPGLEAKAFLSGHFMQAGPNTATELVKASESSAELRELLERITKGSTMFTVAMACAGYVAPPVLWMIGMRQQAAGLSMAAGVDPEAADAAIQDMMAARAHAQAQAAEAPDSAAGEQSERPEGAPIPEGAIVNQDALDGTVAPGAHSGA